MVPYDFVSSFVCKTERPIVWCISGKENYCNLKKNNHNFQASITERYTSVSKSSGIFSGKIL